MPPVYERKAEGHPIPEGVAPHWRFKLDHDAIIDWTDLIRGPQHFDPKLISDPVIRRADGSRLYLLPSVIDDVDLKVTHPARRDHVTNSAIQVQMFEALGATPPAFAHEALLVAAEGKLSKRLGSSGVDELRAAGIEPMALNSLLARLERRSRSRRRPRWKSLAVGLIFRHSAGPRRISTCRSRAGQPQAAPPPRLYRSRGSALDGVGEAEWALLAGNIDHLGELTDWSPVLDGEISPPP